VVQGLDRARAAISPERMRRIMMEIMGEIVREFVKRAREEAPRRTGRLRRSVMLVRRPPLEASVIWFAPYAAVVEFGARPHIITPRRATWLVFEWRGRRVFAKMVRHPGQKPQRFLRRAIRETIRRLHRLVARVFRSVGAV